MRKTLLNLGGLILFYLVFVFGIILLNMRFRELNQDISFSNLNNYSDIVIK